MEKLKILLRRYQKIAWEKMEKLEASKAQKRIKNEDITLICSSCVGGVIYHMLGMRFDSPTINLWINKKEFCKFCSDLEYYMNQELRFYKKEGRNCPCALIGEAERAVGIDFVHYKTEAEAREKWNERKARIHWDNLYIITSDGDNASREDFELLDTAHCKRKIVFTAQNHPEICDSFVLYTMGHEKTAAAMQLTRHRLTGLRAWEREFDYVEWLNDGSKYRKVWSLSYKGNVFYKSR